MLPEKSGEQRLETYVGAMECKTSLTRIDFEPVNYPNLVINTMIKVNSLLLIKFVKHFSLYPVQCLIHPIGFQSFVLRHYLDFLTQTANFKPQLIEVQEGK